MDASFGDFSKKDDLLPAWFVERMMNDEWSFGLLLVTGVVLGVSHICRVHQDLSGALWLDVEMMSDIGMRGHAFGGRVVTAPTSRLMASINAAHVVAAFELADT